MSEDAPQGTDGYPWWNDTVFYTIFVRSFYDSNMDGFGDFNGIIAKLKYLQQLGITGIQLLPVFPSPSFHGYGVTDLCGVNPDYGSMDDFRSLLSRAHELGMRVIIDMIFHNTSMEHPWFVEAAQNPDSPYRDYFTWSPTDQDPGAGVTEGRGWFPSPYGDEYVFSQFGQTNASLNIRDYSDSPSQYIQGIARYWLQEVGVDGFILDAIRHLIPGPPPSYDPNTPEIHTWLKQFHALYTSINEEALVVGEVWGEPPATLATYTAGDEISITFELNIRDALVQAVLTGNGSGLYSAIGAATGSIPNGQFAPLLANHNFDRAMTQLSNDPNKARAAASLLLTMPGVPFLYFGEEIGMQGTTVGTSCCDVTGLNKRNWLAEGYRFPMQWSSECYAGFSAEIAYYPPHPSYLHNNVTAELADPDSLLNHYAALIRLRNENPALRVGELLPVDTSTPALFSILRFRPGSGEAILVLVNLGDEPIFDYGYSLRLNQPGAPTGTYEPELLMGDASFEIPDLTVSEVGFQDYQPLFHIGAFETLIIRLIRK